ncbi:MAG: alkaline phosphatase [Planctomycetia bacterium]
MNRLADWQRGWLRLALVLFIGLAVALIAWPGRKRSATAPAADRAREMQAAAERAGQADWGHWGDRPSVYAAWSNHSNRLIPVYAFGLSLESVAGAKSVYRDAASLERLYGRLPAGTLNPQAEYFDQTDIHRLQMAAADAGKKHIILVVFDGLDWTTTRTAAITTTGSVSYDAGRGHGLFFQDYAGAPTDFGVCVTSPANDGTTFDVDAQAVLTPGGKTGGGYDATLGGATPWDARADLTYLIGRHRGQPHAVTDSAASATSLCTGRKTYNDAINVDPAGAPIEPIAVSLQRQGWGVGVVTSVPMSHATPACAYAANVSRDDYQDIARDQLGEPSVSRRMPLPGLDVLVGCGFGVDAAEDAGQGRNFERGNKYVAASTLRAIDAAEGGRYRVALRTAGRPGAAVLAEAAQDAIARKLRLFGFFGAAEGHLPFSTADHDHAPVVVPDGDRAKREGLAAKYGGPIRYTPADIAENPTLADMTRAALAVLETRDRVWLLVEAGDVDWACHGNNIDNCIGAVQDGDAAFRAVVEWVEARDAWDDTAVIVTSDHGHLFVLTDPTAFAR